MLQIDHIYEFLNKTLFEKITLFTLPQGVLPASDTPRAVTQNDIHVFNFKFEGFKIFAWDQEPLLEKFYPGYLNFIVDQSCPIDVILVSERSKTVDLLMLTYNLQVLYYFFHGFAALDWYRGFYALNYNKQVVQQYKYDYVTFNRLVSNDRSYRCYFVSRLAEELLLEHGQVSFGLPTEQATWQEEITDVDTKLSQHAIDHIKLHLPSRPLIIDNEQVPGWASADIPRCINDSLWHIVTETVFYYDKLHLTEKIFKPIAIKQPFMLIAAPGNLAYLKSYGFKTFDCVIDESYDQIQDPDARIDAVVDQLKWYCALPLDKKQEIIVKIESIVEYNFHHFYGEFKHIITSELLDNTKTVFKEIGYGNTIAYDVIYKVLTT